MSGEPKSQGCRVAWVQHRYRPRAVGRVLFEACQASDERANAWPGSPAVARAEGCFLPRTLKSPHFYWVSSQALAIIPSLKPSRSRLKKIRRLQAALATKLAHPLQSLEARGLPSRS